MDKTITRTRAEFAAAAVLCMLVVSIAWGGSGDPKAKASASGAKQFKQLKQLKRNLKRLRARVENLSRQPGPQGPPGEKGDPGPKGDNGVNVFSSTIPSGTTITGAWHVFSGASQVGVAVYDTYSFPVPAPEETTDVNFGANTPEAQDADPDCTGSSANPTAPPGKVCVYLGSSQVATDFVGQPYTAAGQNTRGFRVGIASTSGGSDASAGGNWAYTAP